MGIPRYHPISGKRKDANLSDILGEIEIAWDASMREIESLLNISKSYADKISGLAVMARRVLFVSATQGSSALAVETDLFNFTVKGGTLSKDLESIEGVCVGNFAATVGNKRVRAYFGATLIFDSGVLAIAAASSWVIRFQIIRTGAATQKCNVVYNSSSAVLLASSSYFASAEAMNANSAFRVTGTGVANGDVLGQSCKGEFLPSA